MSTELEPIASPLGEISVTRFFGGEGNGPSIQLTQRQGSGDSPFHYIQLAPADIQALAARLSSEPVPDVSGSGDLAAWLVAWLAFHPDVRDISFRDGIMVIKLINGQSIDMTEPRYR